MQRFRLRHQRHSSRRGTTLLELMAASTLLTVALVPALGLMRDSMKASRMLETRECLVTCAIGALESETQLMARTWMPRQAVLTAPGMESGFPSVLVDVRSSDDAADSGIPGRLAVIRATAFEDANGNGRFDSGEVSVSFVTQIARFASYDYEGRGA